MRTQSRPSPAPDNERQSQGLRDMLGLGGPPSAPPQQQQQQQQQRPTQILQRPQQQQQFQQEVPTQQQQGQQPDYSLRAPQILQRQHSPQPPRPVSQDLHSQQHFAQPPPRANAPPPVLPPRMRNNAGPQHRHLPPSHGRGPSYNGPPITQAHQMMQMSPTTRTAYMAEEAVRAKRNHKIHLLSKDNGLMTPQDKNFITRIQLQQLLTATGGIDGNEDINSGQADEKALAEDFYYKVYASIRGGREGTGSARFAETYMMQTGGRYGYGRNNRRNNNHQDNHVLRMEQQVARAVEAAKARPKNRSLVVEGSLGKIAFSNSKTPRPLLNLKRLDSEVKARQHNPATLSGKGVAVQDRKSVLRDLEKLYAVLMKVEDHERKMPPPLQEGAPSDVIEGHMRWRSDMAVLNAKLWESAKVMEEVEDKYILRLPFNFGNHANRHLTALQLLTPSSLYSPPRKARKRSHASSGTSTRTSGSLCSP